MAHSTLVPLSGVYDPRLVVLSVLFAIYASYTALDLTARVSVAEGRAWRAWLTGGALALGIGIWSMHFIGMLAYSMPMPVTYDVPTVLGSMLIAIVSSSIALAVVGGAALSLRRLVLGSICLGLGIAAMHYVGMAAMRMPATLSYNPALVALSVAVAIGASLVALWLAFQLRVARSPAVWIWRKLGSALVMGFAISGMHYTAMAAVSMQASAAVPTITPAIDLFSLAITVSIATVLVLGIALLATVVDQRFAAQAAELAVSEQRYRSLVVHHPDAIYQLDRDGVIVSANPAAARLSAITREQLPGRSFALLLPPGEAERAQQRLQVAIQGAAQQFETYIACSQAQQIALRVTYVPIFVNEQIIGVYAIARDISAQQQVAAALAHERDLLHTLMDNIPDTIYFKDTASRFTRINRAQAQVLGIAQPEDALGKTDFDFFTAEHAQAAFNDEQQILRTGQPLVGKLEQSRRPDGTSWWHSATKVPIYDQHGQIIGTVGVSRDVSALREAQEALRQSEARLRTVINHVPIVLFAIDKGGMFTLSEGKGLQALGLVAGEVVGRSVFDVYHDIPGMLADIRSALTGEALHTMHDMAGITFETWYSPVRDHAAQVIGVIGVAIDVTQRLQAETALARLRRQHELILQSAGEGIYGVDVTGNTTFANPAAAQMLGWNVAELLGQPMRSVLNLGQALPETNNNNPIGPTMQDGLAHTVDDALFSRRDGTSFPVEYVCTPIREQGDLIGTVVVFKDISERKRAAEVLRQSIEAQEALRLRDQFLSIASHELKTPLTTLRGNAELLQRRVLRNGLLPEREQHVLQVILQQSVRLSKMIEALLDVSRIQEGRLSIEHAPVDLLALAQRLRGEIQPTLHAHALEVTADAGPLLVAGDELRLEQVLQNLVNNAIKYSPAGGPITIELARHADSVCVRVHDCGLGIPAEALPQLFNRFYRAPNATEQHITGVGIGLFVVKEIVALHNGTVTATSREGAGSTFEVCLPALDG